MSLEKWTGCSEIKPLPPDYNLNELALQLESESGCFNLGDGLLYVSRAGEEGLLIMRKQTGRYCIFLAPFEKVASLMRKSRLAEMLPIYFLDEPTEDGVEQLRVLKLIGINN